MEKRILIPKFIIEFENLLRDDEKSKNTIEKYKRDIKHFVDFATKKYVVYNEKHVSENYSFTGVNVDKKLVLEYKAWLEDEYALTSANSMIAALNSFFKAVGWYECCIKQFKVQKKTYCSEESELTKEEYFSLIQTAESRKNVKLSLILQTIAGTGIRIGELEYITVQAAKNGEAIVSCKGKTRRVFLVSKLCKRLLRYAKENRIDSGSIFITKNGNAVNRSNVWREMKALCVQAGVSQGKVFPHNLRHLFARTFYSIEKDIAKLADILGHMNINTTRIYIITTGAEHRRKLESMKLVI